MQSKLIKAAVLAVVAGSLNSVFATPAEAQVGVAEGRRCGFASEYDPTIEGGYWQTGVVTGGPLVATSAGSTISLTCTIQTGGGNSTHAGADAVSVTSSAGTQAAVVPATKVSYHSPPGQPVYMCSHAVINGVSYYWDGLNTGWSTESSVNCNEAISQETFPHGGDCAAELHVGCYYQTANGSQWCYVWVGGPSGTCLVDVL